MDTVKLLDQLDKVPLGRMYYASFKAEMRLQVYFIGKTHELILDFNRKAQAAILRHGGKEQVLDGASGFAVQSELLRAWGDTWSQWQAEFQQARREAGMIAFGVEAVFHERLIRPLTTKDTKGTKEEGIASTGERRLAMTERVIDGVFDPQLRILLEIAAQFLYGDSANLSERIWRIDRETRDGINQVLMNGITNGSSAWDIAKLLETFLGAGEDCPRWSSTRLYGLTAKDKLTSMTGLLSGDACDGRGVSYNALRLARTEIQKMHALATDRMMMQQPWVEMEQLHLSQSHPETDECDDIVKGGDNGDGIYPKGRIELPIHPNCFCFKTAVLMDEKAFTSKLNGWLKGTGEWRELDLYAQELGVDLSTSLMPAAVSLAVWLLGTDLKL
jgi:hypothetical protein